jgi:microcystin-dependent protein
VGNALSVKKVLYSYSDAPSTTAPGDMFLMGNAFQPPAGVQIRPLGYQFKAGDGVLIENLAPTGTPVWQWTALGPVQGAKGDQGIQGPQGAQGPAGPAGPAGPQGPAGDTVRISSDAGNALVQKTNGAFVQDYSTKVLSVGAGLTGGGTLRAWEALQVKRGTGLVFDSSGNLAIDFGSSAAQAAAGNHVHSDLSTKAELNSAVPIGTIVAFGGASAPAGWHLCDGSAHGSAALQTVLGSPTTPDLRSRFIVGAGTGPGLSGYQLRSTGGAEAVLLTAAQSGLVYHDHSASSGTVSSDHVHGIPASETYTHGADNDHAHWNPETHHGTWGGGGHEHSIQLTDGSGSGDGIYVDTNPSKGTHKNVAGNTAGGGGHEHYYARGGYGTGGMDRSHGHYVPLPANTTGGISANHTHGITVNAAGGGNASQAHENRPPFYALSYIIRKG